MRRLILATAAILAAGAIVMAPSLMLTYQSVFPTGADRGCRYSASQ